MDGGTDFDAWADGGASVKEARAFLGNCSESKLFELFDHRGGPLATKKMGRKRLISWVSLRTYLAGLGNT